MSVRETSLIEEHTLSVAPSPLYTDISSTHDSVSVPFLERAAATSQGTFLPLLVDKLRNNVRSRALLTVVYGVAAAVVAMLLVLSFPFASDNTWEMRFRSPPQSTVAIGEPLREFSVQATDADSKGIQGVAVWLTFIPVNNIEIVVQMSSTNIVSRSIHCISGLVLRSSPTSHDDELYCLPNQQNGLRTGENILYTDSNGVAKFVNYTLGFGSPGLYIVLMVAEILNENGAATPIAQQFVTCFVSLTADVVSFQLTEIPRVKVIPLGETYGQAVRMASTWRSAVVPQYVCAALLPINMQSMNLQAHSVIEPPLTRITTKAAVIVNQTMCTRNITSLGGNLYGVNIALFPSFNSSTTTQLYLGLSFMGKVLPLSSQALDSPFQFPPQVIMSYGVSTNVDRILVELSPDLTKLDGIPTISEGTPIGILTTSALDARGAVLPSKYIYTIALPSDRNPPTIGVSALYSPGVFPKNVLFGRSGGNSALGCALRVQFCVGPAAQFSASGAVGYYDIYIVSDGVFAQWPSRLRNGSTSSNSTGDAPMQDFFTVFVASTVSAAATNETVLWTGGNATEPETVGVPWSVLLSAIVSDSQGNAIPGKMMILQAANVTQCQITSAAFFSQDSGTAFIRYAIVLFVEADGAGGDGQEVEFHLVIDGLIAFNFTRRILYAPQKPSMMEPQTPAADQMPLQCTTLRFLDLPNQLYYSDVTFYVGIQAVSGTGRPVPNATFSCIITAAFGRPAAGKNETVFMRVANSSGMDLFPLQTFGAMGSFGAYFSCSCQPGSPSWFGVFFKNRINKMTMERLNETSFAVSVSPFDWSTISAEYPINIVGQPLWMPNYIYNFFHTIEFEFLTIMTVTGM